ncbi:MAG TPA: HupE/UreJ family protein [Rhodospirillales bacterium]|jgi:urease accessory protein|nr:urease accessory protein [Acidobacteriota bacterium]HJN22719.1 HupE/UreJ family protein [Rhodospirillales bacterium]|tara:strand:- start:584 stop:1174 length:591 start_codon:yes stop_codon:yes gene_type:complete
MNPGYITTIPVAALTILSPELAHAHVYGAMGAGFSHGFAHPFGGLDHLLAMLAVGFWAARMGGKTLSLVPASFVAMMAMGGVIGMSGVALLEVELGIAGSLLVLGALAATAWRLPLFPAMGLVGLFALFHGLAHGAEMPQTSEPALYGMGFVLATMVLHGLGMTTALFATNAMGLRLARASGCAIVITGLAVTVGF